jgi:MFS family permease
MIGGVAIILNMVPIFITTGLSAGTAAGIAGLLGISTITGRLIGGWLMDRMSASVLACFATAGASVLPISLLVYPGSATAASAAVVAYGMCGGVKIPAIAYLASRHFGARAFGTLYGSINASVAFAVALGPLAANFIYDTTKSYSPVMWFAMPALIVAGLLFASLGKYPDFTARPAEA